MHVIVATDGSRQSLAAATQLKAFADPTKITEMTVVAVVQPLAAVAFADELASPDEGRGRDVGSSGPPRRAGSPASPRRSPAGAPWCTQKVRSGSPATEIIKVAEAARGRAGRGGQRRPRDQ